jgi:hypothetical protein
MTDAGLHEPVNADAKDADDWRVCGTCGRDLYDISVCPDAPLADCGCPQYLVNAGEHWCETTLPPAEDDGS